MNVTSMLSRLCSAEMSVTSILIYFRNERDVDDVKMYLQICSTPSVCREAGETPLCKGVFLKNVSLGMPVAP